MLSDAEIFKQWLNGTATVARKISRTTPKVVKFGLLVEQYDGSPSITDGKRRGYNGMRPRESAPELTSDCVVTTAAGDRYTLRHYRNRSTAPVDIDALNRLQAAQAHRVTSADLPAIGNVE